jgi:hypothetical protein
MLMTWRTSMRHDAWAPPALGAAEASKLEGAADHAVLLTRLLSRHNGPLSGRALRLAVATINAWNRLSIAARLVPGTYQPVAKASGTGGGL